MMLMKLLAGADRVMTIVDEFGVASPLIWCVSMYVLIAAISAAGALGSLRARKAVQNVFIPAMLFSQYASGGAGLTGLHNRFKPRTSSCDVTWRAPVGVS